MGFELFGQLGDLGVHGDDQIGVSDTQSFRSLSLNSRRRTHDTHDTHTLPPDMRLSLPTAGGWQWQVERLGQHRIRPQRCQGRRFN
jgi:hypothetical protein